MRFEELHACRRVRCCAGAPRRCARLVRADLLPRRIRRARADRRLRAVQHVVQCAPRHACAGMHFQRAPHAETKLVRCTRGAVFDVLLDLRPGSATFRCWQAVELSEANGVAVYIPGRLRPWVPVADRRVRGLLPDHGTLCARNRPAACAGTIRHSASTGRSGHRSCRSVTPATPITARSRPMNDLVEVSVRVRPTINVRALLDHSARVTKVRARAPLRLGFAGGGTDVSPYCDTFGGCVLNATIGMFAHCSIEVRNDRKVKFVALDYEQEFETDTGAETGTVGIARAAQGGLSADRPAVPRRRLPAGDGDDRFRRAGRIRSGFVVHPGGRDDRGVSRTAGAAARRIRRGASRLPDRARRCRPGRRAAGPVRRHVRRHQLHRVLGRPGHRQSAAHPPVDADGTGGDAGAVSHRHLARVGEDHHRTVGKACAAATRHRCRRCTRSSATPTS